MITVRGITKHFGTKVALQDISFSIRKGEIVALLGENGAGKTTLLRIMTGLLSPDEGSVFIQEREILDNRVALLNKIGYVGENSPLYDYMSVYEYLHFSGEVRKIPKKERQERIEELIEIFDFSKVINQKISELSKGYRHRVSIGGGVIHHPEVLIMDEPSEGLDPNQKYVLNNFMKRYATQATIILSTHILEDVEAVAERLLVLHEGRLLKDTTPKRLKQLFPQQTLATSFRSLTQGDKNVPSFY